jgi:hypothetical protein
MLLFVYTKFSVTVGGATKKLELKGRLHTPFEMA